MTEPPNAGKPSRRLWLLAPAVGAAAVLVGVVAGWFVAAGVVRQTIARETAGLRAAGWTVQAEPPQITGFPLRLKVSLRAVRLRGASGWGVDAGEVEGQAYVYAPDHWVLVAPDGLTIARPVGGPVAVRAGALRASLAGLRGSPWRGAAQAVGARFSVQPGGAPLPLASADLVEAYLRPSPDGRGDAQMLLWLEGGRAAPGGWPARVAGAGPISAMAEFGLTHTAALQGPDLAAAARAWTAAGGRVEVRQARLTSPAAGLQVGAGALAADADGRLSGTLPATLRQSPLAVAALAGEPAQPAARPGDAAPLPLVFGDGRVKLGAITLGPAPKLF